MYIFSITLLLFNRGRSNSRAIIALAIVGLPGSLISVDVMYWDLNDNSKYPEGRLQRDTRFRHRAVGMYP